MSHTVLSALYQSASGGLAVILRHLCCHHFHFTDEETGSGKSNNLPKIIKLVSGGTQTVIKSAQLYALRPLPEMTGWSKRDLKIDIPKEARGFPMHTVKWRCVTGSSVCPES